MPAIAQPFIRPLFLTVFLLCSTAAASAETADLQLSANGSEVLDLRARLAWQRCVHGMEWRNQHCQGTAKRLSYGQAQKLAQSQRLVDGLGWRLPRSNELRRINLQAISGQAAALFPNTPRDWHWSGSAAVNARPVNRYSYEQTGPTKDRLSAQQAWAVDWSNGTANGEMGRGNALLVRLVRPLQADELPSPAH